MEKMKYNNIYILLINKMTSYEVYHNMTFTIKPWNCEYCSYLNTTHPNYCQVCENYNDIYSVLPEADDIKIINKINKVTNVFGKTNNILLPVLACYTKNQFMDNIKNLYTYFKEGKISGIFILTTNIYYSDFISVYQEAKSKFPDFWIGVNLIGENIFKVLEFIKEYQPDGIWVDNSYLISDTNVGICELILNQIKKYNWKGLYFGGVMFKYTNSCNTFNPNILKLAHQYIDVLTTSGDATGIEIKQEKLDLISDNVKDNICIAVASGINPTNIKNISKKSNILIVRTSIVDSDNNIDLEKLNELI